MSTVEVNLTTSNTIRMTVRNNRKVLSIDLNSQAIEELMGQLEIVGQQLLDLAYAQRDEQTQIAEASPVRFGYEEYLDTLIPVDPKRWRLRSGPPQ